MSKYIAVVLFCVVLSFSPVAAQFQDTTPPQLLSFSFAPTQIDTSFGPQAVTVTMQVSDDLSGLHDFFGATINFQHETNNNASAGGFANRIPGAAGLVVTLQSPPLGEIGAIEFEQFMPHGRYLISGVSFQDNVGNSAFFSTEDLQARGFPVELINGQVSPEPTPEQTPPPAPQPQPSPTSPPPPTPTSAPAPLPEPEPINIDGPDLSPTFMKLTHNAKRLPGDKLRVQVAIINNGRPTSERFFVTWVWRQSIEDDNSERFLFNHMIREDIGRGDNIEISLKMDDIFPRLEGGHLIARIDSTNDIVESNEQNNILVFGLGTICPVLSNTGCFGP